MGALWFLWICLLITLNLNMGTNFSMCFMLEFYLPSHRFESWLQNLLKEQEAPWISLMLKNRGGLYLIANCRFYNVCGYNLPIFQSVAWILWRFRLCSNNILCEYIIYMLLVESNIKSIVSVTWQKFLRNQLGFQFFCWHGIHLSGLSRAAWHCSLAVPIIDLVNRIE
jgi:hypothetical protein